ncbi:MAG TPA: octaprenyl diphosphate synthase [Pseudomonadales bacterium]|nr:octaprenyl diphosphate synthase [Pseudomonadales bacterium]
MDFQAIKATVDADFNDVNSLILQQLHSRVPLVDQVGHYIVNSGGKRLRPLVCLLAARAGGYLGAKHVEVAAVVEFLHTATLLHDDVVDESMLRRGKATANAVWGNSYSVLVGDFLISRAFQMIVSVGNMRIMQILSDATNVIAEGEVLQLINCKDPDTTEARYMEVIHHKTAKMFEAAAQAGAVLAGCSAEQEQAMASYAIKLGSAFQIVDDVLDYTGSAEEMGKNVGDDLAEGKPTLPLIYAIRSGSAEQSAMIRDAIRTGGLQHLQQITEIVKQTGALDYSLKIANEQAEEAVAALQIMPDSPYRKALEGLARLAVNRSS